ncbi:hypothetical protein J0A68_20815 [Algoriphagus sp. H41]|uniref:Uncharacterized protein n=1 Tax=Algoriphagus oliviformis TaxID=2811231 RepID=A0ABS3C8H1_9BACT|nr:hypothetical protein [Algoriphagus oliviformis]MBN7813410.1 hypothetical protein [Algoriphagus oliviformis]
MKTLQEVQLKVDFITMDQMFAIAEKNESIVFNLSEIASKRKEVYFERLAGQDQSHLISAFGRWIVVFDLVEETGGKEKSPMQFIDLNADPLLVRGFMEESKDVFEDIMAALEEYKKAYKPSVHNFVRLVGRISS